LAFALFLVEITTGVLLVFYYVPHVGEANESVKDITYVVRFGWLVRSMHYWAAQLMVISTALHLIRLAAASRFKLNCGYGWGLGVLLLILIMTVDFTGYLLRWDESTYWALSVGVNLIKHLPLVGDGLYRMAVGGDDIGQPALTRFFVWHCFGMPLLIFALLNSKCWPCTRVKLRAYLRWLSGRADEDDPMYDMIERDLIYMTIAIVMLLSLSLILIPPIGDRHEYGTPSEEANAPWMFLWIQEMLFHTSSLVGGVILPAVMIGTLFFVPKLSRFHRLLPLLVTALVGVTAIGLSMVRLLG
jgi:quinol-cytochrome oxidoreductase complex cytochrome b subunit